MEYAKSLIKRRPGEKHDEDDVEDIEENWTFVGDENEDTDVLTRVKSLDGKDLKMGPGLDEALVSDFGRRIEAEMGRAGPVARERDEKGIRKNALSQVKLA